MDKRGVGRSQGPSLDESTLADLTQDFRACYQFLHKQPAVDSRRVSLLGHSEGAMIGPMIACKEPGICSLVLLAPPAVAGGEIWIHQKLGGLRQQGAKPEVLESVEKEMHRLVQFVKSGTNDDDTYYRIGHDFIKAHGMPEEKITHSLIDKLLSDLRTKSYRDFFSHNPAEALSELRTPTLAILSSADDQVTVKQNLVPLAAALASAKNPDFTISVLPEQDHYFLVFEGHRLKRHNFGKMKVAPVLLDTVTTWLRRPAPST
jgi:pimeloyl-ACP methyl ester carboxylesterase